MENHVYDLLKKRKKQVLENWINYLIEDTILQDDLITNEEMRQQSQEIIDLFTDAIKTGNYTDIEAPEYEQLNDSLASLSISRAQQGFSPKETSKYIFSLKEAIIKQLEIEYKKKPALLYEELKKINKVIDSLGTIIFETYLKGREEVIIRQTNEISEISTPVIRVWEGIVAMPIIGTLDSARTQVVMESLLQEIVNSGSSIAILDISGVPAVDSLVAQHLMKTVSATRLMGAECIISGIRPEIAQTVVHLGINLSDIVTKASLASALSHAFKLVKLEVRKTSQQEKKLL
jgi:rsbT co-antagonist protein RsbR